MTLRLCLWLLFFMTTWAFGQTDPSQGYPEDFQDDGFGFMVPVFFLMFLGFIAVCSVLVGIGMVMGVSILAGLMVMLAGLAAMLGVGGVIFGTGGVLASLAGGIASRRPKVGWRIFSMWMHGGIMALAGLVIGGFIIPFLWSEYSLWLTGSFSAIASFMASLPVYKAILGTIAGLGVGLLWGWLLALGVERCGGVLKSVLLPRLGLKAVGDKQAVES